jgi:hypothetical protein
MAARWNSSRAPKSPLSLMRSKPWWILRCAKRISTRLRSSRDLRKRFVPISRRARSRASSWRSRGTCRAAALSPFSIRRSCPVPPGPSPFWLVGAQRIDAPKIVGHQAPLRLCATAPRSSSDPVPGAAATLRAETSRAPASLTRSPANPIHPKNETVPAAAADRVDGGAARRSRVNG